MHEANIWLDCIRGELLRVIFNNMNIQERIKKLKERKRFFEMRLVHYKKSDNECGIQIKLCEIQLKAVDSRLKALMR
ncbi:MAG: hypothetical protein R3321_09510 [Nitrososphaeraceae archaeon]|nr:hypothetical protein [Nitrososphaeraceae archaeon]